MIELDKIIEIIKVSHSLGAKRITIDADGSVGIEWAPSVYYSPAETTITTAEEQKEPVMPVVALYAAQLTQTTCKENNE